ncbi:MAG: type IV pilus twitching motility protein PilT [Elusimicrobiota bacterium]|jgi:twitching motility protein PilT
MELIDVLSAAVRMGASDLHLSAGCPPMARARGEVVPVPGLPVIAAEECRKMVLSLLYDEQRARFEEKLELDCSIQVPGLARFRMNVLQQKGMVEAVFRVIPAAIPTPEYLGLGPTAMGLADLPRGLVLVTGPTGCGKSTTLACMLEYINQRYRKHIITLEDPIEYVYANRRSIVRQREVGTDTHSFSEALRHALRQDPDVIMVGEMRDLETISMALTAAETGHLCFATLHTSDSAQTVDRIVDVFPAHQQQQVRIQLADTLKGVLSQVLLGRSDGRGMIAARELLLVTPAVSNLIREGKSHLIPNTIETCGRLGMFTLDKSLQEMVARGIVPLSEALSKAHDPQRLSGRPSAAPAPVGAGVRA